MKQLSEMPRPVRSELTELYRLLRLWWGMRHIEESAYLVGMHVLQKMAKLDSLEVACTWEEFCNQVVVRGDEILAGPVDGDRFRYLGALQQLHSVLGVFSHVTQEGIETDKEFARSNKGVGSHFSKGLGDDSLFFGPSTPMLFVFVPWAGYDADLTWTEYQNGGRKVHLPSWLKAKGRVAP